MAKLTVGKTGYKSVASSMLNAGGVTVLCYKARHFICKCILDFVFKCMMKSFVYDAIKLNIK